MKLVAIALVAACGSSTSAPPPAPPGPAWKVSYELFLRQDGVDDRIDLDATGTMHHDDSGVDCGPWSVPADQLAPIEALVRAPDLFDSTPSDRRSFEGGSYSLETGIDGVSRKHSFSVDEDAPRAKALAAAFKPLIAAHDRDNLAAVGPFHVDVVDDMRHTSVHADSAGKANPAALARLATLLRCPALADAKDVPGNQPAITFTIQQGGTTRRIVDQGQSRLLDTLYGAVDDAKSAK